MARDASTYRGARRNKCIREMKFVWGPEWYYGQHRNTPEWWVQDRPERKLNMLPIYVPRLSVERKKQDPRGSAIHVLLRSGRYAEAVRAFFRRGQGARGS